MLLDVTLRREAYLRMLRIRKFEEHGTELYKKGSIPGAYHASIGQEAAIVGACLALREDDYITGTHRSHGHPIGKGARLDRLMAELLAKETGVCAGRGGSMHLADATVGILGESAIVGGGIPIAAGAAMSAKIRGTDQVALSFFGDGASNQGTFHETINMAAVWKLPVIFFCENNLYALTTPVVKSHGQPDIYRRAAGYGIPGVMVDGQDITAVFEVTSEAVRRARLGQGPTLIEAKTYRFDEHQIGLNTNNDRAYRTHDEILEYKAGRDPIVIFRDKLIRAGMCEKELLDMESQTDAAVQEAISFAEQSPTPTASDVYRNMYAVPINYPPQPFESIT